MAIWDGEAPAEDDNDSFETDTGNVEAAGISLASALEIYNRERAKRKNKIWAFAIVLVAKASQFQHRLIKKLPPLYVIFMENNWTLEI